MKKLKLDEQKIIELYKNTSISSRGLGKLYTCGKTTILRILKRNNVSPKPLSQFNRPVWNKGKTNIHSPERINQMRQTKLGTIHSEETRKKMSVAHTGRIYIDKGFSGKKHSIEALQKISIKSKARWADKEYRERVVKAILKGKLVRPTSLEKKAIEVIQKYNLPYKYVGDGSFLIGYKNPDFVNINGEKKLVEIGNVFHHQGNYVEDRKAHFAKYGWESKFLINNQPTEEEILNIFRFS